MIQHHELSEAVQDGMGTVGFDGLSLHGLSKMSQKAQDEVKAAAEAGMAFKTVTSYGTPIYALTEDGVTVVSRLLG